MHVPKNLYSIFWKTSQGSKVLLNDSPFLTQGHRELGVMFTYQNRSLCKNPLPGSPCSAEKTSHGAHGSRCRLRSSCLSVPGSTGGLPDARSSGAACRERQSSTLSDRWRWFRGSGSLGTPWGRSVPRGGKECHSEEYLRSNGWRETDQRWFMKLLITSNIIFW